MRARNKTGVTHGRTGFLETFRNDLARIGDSATAFSATQTQAITPLELMTIILEDRRFFHHFGVDLQSVLRETAKAMRFRAHGGASTIDMQFVRTVTGFRRNTLTRKLYEMALAMALQAKCGKWTIIRSYLACAYFGSGLIGADAAGDRVFGKRADLLDLEEAAFIAAMLACPRPLNGSPKWEAKVRRRAHYALAIYHSNQHKFLSRYNVRFAG